MSDKVSAPDACDGLVSGRRMTKPIAALTARARLLLLKEQAKPAPDNALIDFICEAVRMGRECCDHATDLGGAP